MTFSKQNGMSIEMNQNLIKNFICCTVDWISKFPDECDILIARTMQDNGYYQH